MLQSMRLLASFAFAFFVAFNTSFAAEASSQPNQEYDVIIVGGGIAGLATLNELAAKGITNVLLLEGDPRVGGKMWTERRYSDAGSGPYYERGAELVNTSDVELIELIRSLGLSLTERRFKREVRSEVLIFRDRYINSAGEVVTGEPKAFTFDQLVEKMHEFPQDVRILEAVLKIQSDRSSKDRLLAQRTARMLRDTPADVFTQGGVYSTLLLEALFKSEFGVSLKDVNAEVLMDYIKLDTKAGEGGARKFNIEIIPSADEKFRVTNGTDSIIEALAKKHKEKIQTLSKVSEVEELSPAEFKLTVKRGETKVETLKAKHVVFAVPAYDLGKIKITSSHISPARLQNAADLPFGHNAKIFLVFKEKFWNKEYRPGSNTFGGVGILERGVQFWDTTENQKAKEGVITIYPGEWPSSPEASEKRLAEIMAELRRVPGLENLDHYLSKVDIQNWKKSYAGVFNPNYKGSPSLFAEKLPTNMYFVGADKDNNQRGKISESYGYMNGAVRTALRAAASIVTNVPRTIALRGAPAPLNYGKLKCAALF